MPSHRTLIPSILFALALGPCAVAQPVPVPAGEFRFLPDGLGVAALPAHPREPRLGIRKELGGSRLKLDLGAALDLAELRLSDRGDFLRAGIDLFTYALTTNNQGLRLQVDAVDGFFGGHLSVVRPFESSTVGLRLRLLHLSAHMVDGHIDRARGGWTDGREPIPFTRDFGELTCVWTRTAAPVAVRAHAGFSYATLVRPATLKRFAGLAGVEVRAPGWPGTIFDRSSAAYCAWNICLDGIPAWAGSNSIELGLSAGNPDGRGLRLYLSYYSGLEVFSQYYDLRRSAWGAGFAFDI